MISRIHFRRAVKDKVLLKSIISFEIIIGGEFNEPIKSSLRFSDIEVFLLEGVLKNNHNTHFSDTKILKFQSIHDSFYHISVTSPQSAGEYFLRVSIKSGEFIMPAISGRFSVIDFANQSSIRPLLCCFREITLPVDISTARCIYIQEEYGATLGSHLYDSSIVLLRYLSQDANAIITQSHGMVVELGAGCGLLGIFLALLANPPGGLQTLMTDKQCQLDLLHRNVRLNDVTDRCTVVELDWQSEAHFLAVQEIIRSSAAESEAAFVGTIIATDVLYDQVPQ